MNHNTSNYISISSGSILGIIKGVSLFKIVDVLSHGFEVLIYGIIGAIGGAIGTAIIRFIVKKVKRK